jgi:Asp-tRNA(Asn)/Glu-tRNA(Gln) amidotransferase A subunit family amidase
VIWGDLVNGFAGPFAGVPSLLKDLLTSYAGGPLTMGSKAYRKYILEESV